jgi:hypothetical protein
MLGTMLQLGTMFIPGLQPYAPFLNAAGALMSGNPMGAATSLAGGIANSMNQPQINEDSLIRALLQGARKSYMPQGENVWDEYREQLNAPYGGRRRF